MHSNDATPEERRELRGHKLSRRSVGPKILKLVALLVHPKIFASKMFQVAGNLFESDLL